MQRNWSHPNHYQQQPQPHPYQQQPQWQQGRGWNDHPMNYDHGQHFYRQITIEEAMNIALEQVPGQVVKVEMDTEKGVQVYEVDIVTAQNVKYEVAVNMNTGEIVEIELD